jgi:hypothetical protein
MRAMRLAANARGVRSGALALSPMTSPLITKKMSTPFDPWVRNAVRIGPGSATANVPAQ